MIEFEVRGVPAPQGSHRAVWSRTAKRAIVLPDNKRMKPWRDLVALVAQQHAPARPFVGAVEVALHFYLPQPKSLPKRVQYHARRPDLDKLVRAALDAMSGVIWRDDAQVRALNATKSYDTTPRLEVSVAPLEASDRSMVEAEGDDATPPPV